MRSGRSALRAGDLAVSALRLELFAKLHVAVVTRSADELPIYRGLHGAVRLRDVLAVRKAAMAQKWAELGEAGVQRLRGEGPHADLAQPWSVDDIATRSIGERDHVRPHGGVPPFVDRFADLAYAQIETRKEGV